MTHDLKSVASKQTTTGQISGTATHDVEAAVGVRAEIRGEAPTVKLHTGKGTVTDMGFAPLELSGERGPNGPPTPRPGGSARSAASGSPEDAARVATLGFQWRGQIRVPFQLSVQAAAEVALEAVVKQTKSEGQVVLRSSAGESGA